MAFHQQVDERFLVKIYDLVEYVRRFQPTKINIRKSQKYSHRNLDQKCKYQTLLKNIKEDNVESILSSNTDGDGRITS